MPGTLKGHDRYRLVSGELAEVLDMESLGEAHQDRQFRLLKLPGLDGFYPPRRLSDQPAQHSAGHAPAGAEELNALPDGDLRVGGIRIDLGHRPCAS
jgi:hypothetical protein